MAILKKIGKALAKGERGARRGIRRLKKRNARKFDVGIDRAVGKIPGVSRLKRFVRSRGFSKMAKRRLAERRAKKDK